MPAALDRDVFHRQWARAALLHRTVLATRLRELYARRRHAADAARDLDRAGLSRFPQGAQIQRAAGSLRQLRLALEPVAFNRVVTLFPLIPANAGIQMNATDSESLGPRLRGDERMDTAGADRLSVAVIIPTFNEAESIAAVIAEM